MSSTIELQGKDMEREGRQFSLTCQFLVLGWEAKVDPLFTGATVRGLKPRRKVGR